MVCGKIEKTAGLLIALYILTSAIIYVPDWSVVGVARGCDILQRLGYSFFMLHSSMRLLTHGVLYLFCFYMK